MEMIFPSFYIDSEKTGQNPADLIRKTGHFIFHIKNPKNIVMVNLYKAGDENVK